MGTFRARIEEAAHAYPMERCRLVRLFSNPKCPSRLLRNFGASMVVGAELFPGKLARLFAAATHPALRAIILENMFEEEGFEATSDGFRQVPERRHAIIARKLGRAVGVTQSDLDRAPARARGWFEDALDQDNWLGAFAYLNIGQEGNTPRFMIPISKALQERGIARADLEFLDIHGEADVAHGNRSIDVAILIATTSEQQQIVLDAVARGARDFWELNN